jgi:streptomycin 6-kinase
LVSVPEAFADGLVGRCGDGGRRWLEALPALVEQLCDRWRVELLEERTLYGDNNLVFPVQRANEGCMLKVCWPEHDITHEAKALLAWNGHGAVRLLDASPDDGALLLERLDAGRSLVDVELFCAAEVAGNLIRRLTIPAPAGFRPLSEVATQIAETVGPRQNALGRPLSPRWVDLAAQLAHDLAADAGADLVHADLHYANILAGTRQSWLAIDPRAVAGDPEHSVPELMWTRLDDAEDPTAIRTLLATLVRAGDLDPDKAKAWTIVRAVDYWLWGLGAGFTEDPARCHRLLDTLTQ